MDQRLEEMYQIQSDLMKQFDEIEKAHGMLMVPNPMTLDLNDKFGQARAKDFAWRMTEEVTEAIHSYQFGTMEEYKEEVIDVYHFLLELIIMTKMPLEDLWLGFNKDADLESMWSYYKDGQAEYQIAAHGHHKEVAVEQMKLLAFDVVKAIGSAMNLLKYRPWKANHTGKDTDMNAFWFNLAKAHHEFVQWASASGITPQDLYHRYVKKSDVNKQRIASGT